MNDPIVLLTNRRDLAADEVVHRLDQLGVPVLRLNVEDLAARPTPRWSLDLGSGLLASAIWWRQFELAAPESLGDAASVDDLLLVRAQWRAWLSTLPSRSVPWINDLWSARRAENKVEQLSVASGLGASVPPTLITNDRGEAERFHQATPAVVKTLAAAYFETSALGFVYTQRAELVLEQSATTWLEQPLIVQSQIDGANVRVIAFGKDTFGAACVTSEVDWRTAGREGATWSEWPVPGSISTFCYRYLDAFGLEYGAFDFIDDGSAIWFLEANQAGEWVFIDRALSIGIADAFTSHLVALANRKA